ncbi:g1324 [Coccomyxa elongata]
MSENRKRQAKITIACTEKKAEENDDGRKTSTTLSSLARLLGKDEDEDVTQRNPADCSEEQNDDSDQQVQWWAALPTNQSDPPRRKGMDPGEEGRILTDGGSYQRTGQPVKAGSNKFDIPTVTPYLAYALLFLNLAVYGAGIGLALTQGNDFSNEWFLSLAKINEKIASGEVYRLLTCTFLHAGILHLGLNCWALFSIGPEVEGVMGYSTFAAIYILSGLAGSTASFLFSDLITVGASGAIFGLLGATAGYFLRNRALQGSTQQLTYIAGIVGLNIFLGSSPGSMIDNSGHLGGLFTGLALGYVMAPKWDVVREVDLKEGTMMIPEEAEEIEVVVDRQPSSIRIAAAVCCALSLLVLVGVGITERGPGG